MGNEEEIGAEHVEIVASPMDPGNFGDGEGFKYTRDEMFAIYWAMGDSYYNGVAEVWAVLEPLSQELYEMDVDHGTQKPRHKTIDRRQRGRKATRSGSEENSYEEELLLELGLDVPSQSQSSVSEGEVYEDDSDEEVESFQPLAFAVEGEPDFESGEPQDGWEYLRRVKWEFKRCPKVVVANVDPKKFAEQTSYMPSIPSVSTCSPHLLPAKEWETEFLADFSNLRMKYAETISDEEKFSGPLPSIHNQVGWETFCFGKSTSPVEEETSTAFCMEDNPESTGELMEEAILSTEDQPKSVDNKATLEGVVQTGMVDKDSLPNLDSVTDFPALIVNATSSDEELHSNHEPALKIRKHATEASPLLIKTLVKNAPPKDGVKRKPSDLKGPNPPLLGILMQLDEVKRAALLRYHIAWLERVDGLPEGRAQWLFALSVVVDKPLDAQTMAAYRALLRRCASLRTSKTSAEDVELHRLNMLITIAGRYFGQAEDALS